MSDETQNSLQEALEKLKNVEERVDGSVTPQLTEIRGLIEKALQRGQGQEAVELRQRIDDIIMENAGFISFMVHEIRKPMTSLRGYSDMLHKGLMGELNDMQAQFIATIRNNVISMEKLVSDISDISKMQSGRLKPDPKMDMAKNILLAVQKETAEMAEEAGHELVFDIPDGLPLLNLDSTRAVQAVIKLVDNALKYTPEGGKVVVSAEPVEGGLQIHVSDNGVGMNSEELEKLGELFFRGDDDLVTNTKGYGLGIPIVIECMKMVNGRLSYESTKGEGSRFSIFLPGMS